MDEILATIRRIISEDEQAAPTAGSGAATGAGVESAAPDGGKDRGGDSDDVLELTEAIIEDGSTRHLAPIGSSSRRAANMREPPPAASQREPEPNPEPGPQRREAPSVRPAPGQAAPVDERLVSDVASVAATAAFARLATVRRAPREPPMVGERTLEDIVGDLLRPLLRIWLDENLPHIVERLVAAEIARVVDTPGVP